MNNKKQYFIFLVGEFFSKGLLFLLFPMAGKVMDVESFGKLSLIHPAMQTLLVVFSFGLTNTLSLIFYVGQDDAATKLIKLLKSWFFVSSILFLIILLLFIDGQLFFGLGGHEVIFAVIFLQLLSIQFLLGTYFQFGEFYRHFLINQIGYRLIIVLTLCYFIVAGNSISFMQFIILSVSILVVLVSSLLKPHVNLKSILFADASLINDLKHGFPLVLNGIVSYFVIVAPRLSLTGNSDSASLILFSVTQSFIAVLTIFYASLSRIFSPNIFRFISLGDASSARNYVNSLISDLSGPALMAVSFVAFAAVEFSRIYFLTYDVDIALIILLCIPYLFQLLYASHVDILYARKKGLFVTCLLVASAASTYFTSNYMYQEYGVQGVAFATSVNIVIQYVLVFFMARFLLGFFAIDLRVVGWFFVSITFLSLYYLSVEEHAIFIAAGIINLIILFVAIYKSMNRLGFVSRSKKAT